jgi:virulence factor Mce-like protein
MNKQRPSNFAMFTMVAFTASCIGLLIFLWISFGGSLPLAAQGYRFSVEFDQAVELASQASVQISGVPVGHVVSVGLDHKTGLSQAVIEIDKQYAPRPADTRAILRSKTLLGETYVELSPGNPHGPKLPDGGSLPRAQVAPTVQLDQIFSAFDPKTRQAFQTWMQQGGIALTGRGEDFNRAFGELYPFATNVDSVLAVLNRQSAATSTLLRDGAQVFAALSRSPAALQGFVRNSNSLFAATAARNADLAATIRAFPAFLNESRTTINRLGRFAQTTKPLIDELQPAAVQLTPALQGTAVLAPELRDLMVNIAPLTQASKVGFPALSDFLNDTIPFLTRLTPYLGELVPVINYIQSYRREITAFFANSVATSQGQFASGNGGRAHYVRISNPINPELLTGYTNRPYSNRSNAYMAPGGYNQLLTGLNVFGSFLCTSNPLPTIGSSLSQTTTTVTGTVLTLAQLVAKYYFTSQPGGPPCKAQPPLGSTTTGSNQTFPHLQPLP